MSRGFWYGPGKDTVFTLTANCCQCYFWCNCPCDKCQKVVFEIKDGDNGDVLGNLNKEGKGCMRNAIALD